MSAAIVCLDERRVRRDEMRAATGFLVATLVAVALFWIPLFWWLL